MVLITGTSEACKHTQAVLGNISLSGLWLNLQTSRQKLYN